MFKFVQRLDKIEYENYTADTSNEMLHNEMLGASKDHLVFELGASEVR